MTDHLAIPGSLTPHGRLLQTVDELHRLGFEQLRFSRNSSTIYWRLQVYAARDVQQQDGSIASAEPLICMSFDTMSSGPASAETLRQWETLLRGTMKPRHLAGRFILDFPDLARAAYGADHAYRTWFRQLRPHLHAGYLPSTWEEDWYDGDINYFLHHVLLRHPMTDQTKRVPRPPVNPFVLDAGPI